uniref:Mediator of RNA polymerase II transcription subunit 20 n=1 Tax=Solanum lycopersicum TaxID=4081 RepID=A0A3Q7JAX3_SOLLC
MFSFFHTQRQFNNLLFLVLQYIYLHQISLIGIFHYLYPNMILKLNDHILVDLLNMTDKVGKLFNILSTVQILIVDIKNISDKYNLDLQLREINILDFCSRYLSIISTVLFWCVCLSLHFVTLFVVRVLCWQPNAGITINRQILIEVSNCIESINGVKEGGWKNNFCFYKPILKGISSYLINHYKDWTWEVFLPSLFFFLLQEPANESEIPQIFLGVSLQEQPEKFYMALIRQRLIVEAESSMQTIMENLQSYKMKLAINCEVCIILRSGFQYRLGDFRMRVGKVVPINSENLRGIVIEMEYLPISSWETSHLIMSEFFEILKVTLGKKSLPGHFVHTEPNFSKFGLSDQYTSQHTVVQYASILAQMTATSQSS